jgi:tetratricopeptide (TPR) repeat protein
LALNSLTKYKEAIKSFDQALSLDPKYAKALNNKGDGFV